MFGRKQTTTLLILIVGLLSLTLLATNLIASGWVPTADGFVPTPSMPTVGDGFIFPQSPFAIPPDRWRNTIIALLIVLAIASLIAMWYSPRLRKLFVTYCITIILAYLYLGPDNPPLPVEELTEGAPAGEIIPLPPLDGVEVNERPEVGEPPSWFRAFVALFPAIFTVAAGLFLIRRYLANSNATPLAAEIAQNAEEALLEIEQGYDLRGAIIGAYVQMTETVRRNRGIVRKSAVTASEFVEVLQKAGLPLSPVERLTRLFEQVRYSPDTPGVRDQREAVSCLGEIVTAAERIKGRS